MPQGLAKTPGRWKPEEVFVYVWQTYPNESHPTLLQSFHNIHFPAITHVDKLFKIYGRVFSVLPSLVSL